MGNTLQHYQEGLASLSPEELDIADTLRKINHGESIHDFHLPPSLILEQEEHAEMLQRALQLGEQLQRQLKN